MPKITRRKLFSLVGILLTLSLVAVLVTQIDKVRQLFSRANISGVPLNGTYFYIEDIESGEIKPILSEIKSLGMDTIITSSLKHKNIPMGSEGQACHGDYRFVRSSEANYKKILDEADNLGLKVYVGLIHSEGLCKLWPINPLLADEDAQETESIVQWVLSNFPDHPAIAGWSISNEAALGYEARDFLLEGYGNYYKKQVTAIRKYSRLPIITAPSLLNFELSPGGPSSPNTVAERAKTMLQVSGLDVLVFQDSVGGGAVPLSSWSQKYSVKDYYNALAKSLGSEHLWADLEVFTWSSDGYSGGGGYRPASISRISNQINETSVATKRVIWIQQRFLGTTDAWRLQVGNEPERLFDAYRAMFQNIGGVIKPQNYTWITTPDNKYPDSGNELFNGLIGDPKFRAFDDWVGIQGSAEVVFSFKKETPLWWVSFHILHKQEFAVGFPDKLSLSCSSDQTNWDLLGSWSLPVNKLDSEYVFSNPQKLNVSCKHLKARLDNSVWTFTSEVEIIGPETAPQETSNPTPTSVPATTPTPHAIIVNTEQCKLLNNLCKKQGGLFCEMAKQRNCR